MQNQKRTFTVNEATKKLEHFCAYQERCHREVRQKLESMSIIPDAIDIIIVHLLKHNFLNEERFAKAFVRGKFNVKHWGRYRLNAELKKRNISKTIINTALKEIDDVMYIEKLNALIEKKANSITESNIFKKRKKLVDYMLYRGWESSLVYDIVNDKIK